MLYNRPYFVYIITYITTKLCCDFDEILCIYLPSFCIYPSPISIAYFTFTTHRKCCVYVILKLALNLNLTSETTSFKRIVNFIDFTGAAVNNICCSFFQIF